MRTGRYMAWARVSSREQEQEGFSLEAATGAKVHLDLPFGAEEMTLELDAVAARTGALEG